MSIPAHVSHLPARFVVLGGARSGIAAARYLIENGHAVFVSDTCEKNRLDFLLASNELAQVPHESIEHTERVLDTDTIILSPGIPSNVPVLALARKRGIPVWSEIELGYRVSRASFWAVTGSTGKSTTVTMAGAIVAAAGMESVVCGNIGIPVIAAAPPLTEEGIAIVEVSSFQLETIDRFRPDIALVTNFMKNHLDRYRSEENYYAAKRRLALNMDRSCTMVLNATDARLWEWGQHLIHQTNVVWYGRRVDGQRGVWFDKGRLRSSMDVEKVVDILNVDDMVIAGRHNYDNAAGAAAMALAAGITVTAVADGLRKVKSLPHRLALVGTRQGVRWYNDSKSTTAESVAAAVSAFDRPVHLIAGGRDKGCDFKGIAGAVRDNVREAILIGEASARMASAWKHCTTIVKLSTLEEAVQHAAMVAREGDIVVLSPGCSSFDMFTSYEQRGTRFSEIVGELPD